MHLHYYLKKTQSFLSEMYGDKTPSERTCRVWFECFRNGDFDVRNKECPGQSKKFEDVKLQKLLNPIQTLLELSKALNIKYYSNFVLAVSKLTGKIYKEGI